MFVDIEDKIQIYFYTKIEVIRSYICYEHTACSLTVSISNNYLTSQQMFGLRPRGRGMAGPGTRL
jgi:hypothetical protein